MQSDIKWEFVDCGNDKGMLEAWKSVTGNQLKVGLERPNGYKCFQMLV